jgi:hypothetical protein
VNPSLIRQTLENPSFHRVRILWIKTGHRNNQQKKHYRKRMGKKNPKNNFCYQIDDELLKNTYRPKEKKHKKSELLRNPNCKP